MNCAGSEVTSLTSHRNDYESGNNQACSESIDPSPCIDFQPDERWHIEEDIDDVKLKLQQKAKPENNEQNILENFDSHKHLLGTDSYSEKFNETSDDQNEKSAFGNGKVPVLLKTKPLKEPMKFNGDVDKQHENNISVSPNPEKMLSGVSEIHTPTSDEQLSVNASKQSLFEISENSNHSDSKFSVTSFKYEIEKKMGGEQLHVTGTLTLDGSLQSGNMSDSNQETLNEESSSNLSAINSHEELCKPLPVENTRSIAISESTTSLVVENVKSPTTVSEESVENPRISNAIQEVVSQVSGDDTGSSVKCSDELLKQTSDENVKSHSLHEEEDKPLCVKNGSSLVESPVKALPSLSSESIKPSLSSDTENSMKLPIVLSDEIIVSSSVETTISAVTLTEESKIEKKVESNNISNKVENQVKSIVVATSDKNDKTVESDDDDDDDDNTELDEETKLPCGLDKLVKAGRYIPVKIPQTGNFKLREKEALLECPSLVTPLLLLREPAELFIPREKTERVPHGSRQFYHSKDYLNSTVGKFLIGLGLSRVKEWYHRDMMKVKERQMKRDGKTTAAQVEHLKHEEAFTEAKRANMPFTFQMQKCELCSFNTESALVMEGHYLIPHVTSRREFRCSYCTFMTRDPKLIMFHYEAIHDKQAILEPPAQFYECPNCPYEVNLKTRANSHISRCQRTFLFSRNQAPVEFDLPGVTAKLVNVSDIKHYEMSLASCGRGIWSERERSFPKMTPPTSLRGAMMRPQRQLIPAAAKPYTTTMPLYQQLSNLTDSTSSNAAIHKHNQQIVPPGIQLPSGLVITRPKPPAHTRPAVRSCQASISLPLSQRQLYQVVNASGQVVPVIDKKPLTNHNTPHLPWLSSVETIVTQSNSGPQPVALFPNIAAGGTESPSVQTTPKAVVSVHQIPPNSAQLPRLQGPYPPQGSKSPSPLCNILAGSRFVICEICDGYIKDLDQLRIHMHLIHKVKIHPKMLASRPPLNCQKCQWRFFTDQGLERHLLGAHGLVTSNMQDMANKNQDSGRCTICGGVYACKLVSHMSQVHKVTLKPAHLSYKCTVCTATFNLYKLFETHVYMAHSGAMKRSTEDSSQRPAKKAAISQVANKGSPQVVSVQPSLVCSEEDNYQLRKCKECGIETEEKDMLSHLRDNHIKKCFVKLCRIEKCEKCLCSFDGLVVLYTADFGMDDDDGDND